MFWSEFKKMWLRPEVIIAFVLVCFIPLAGIIFSLSKSAREYDAAYEKYAGQMDMSWKEAREQQYDDYLSDPVHLRSDQEYKNALAEWGMTEESPGAEDAFYRLKEKYYTTEFVVLESAYRYREFREMLSSYVQNLQNTIAAQDADYDLTRVSAAYEKLGNASDTLVFDSSVGKGAFFKSYFYFSKCFLVFLILLCASVFTGEERTGMADLLRVSKHGRRKLYWRKFAVCQLTAVFVPAVVFGILAAVVEVTIGWRGLSGFVQDFVYNFCPYAWSEGEDLAVMLVMFFAVCQVAAAVIFLLSRIFHSTGKIICVSLAVLLLPTFLFSTYPRSPLRLYLTSFFTESYLWSGYSEIRIGQIYLADWKIAVAEVCIIFAIAFLLILRYGRKSERRIKE